MINPDTAARIKACQGVYSMGDTAKYFGVSKRTVHSLWHGKTHVDVSPAPEAVNINSSRIPHDVIAQDVQTLLGRGMTIEEAAQEIGVSRTTVFQARKKAGVQQWYFFS